MYKFTRLDIAGVVSGQNPAFAPLFQPGHRKLVITDWRGGYNKPPGHIKTYDLDTHDVKLIVGGDYSNCSQPGACWHTTAGIILSSDRWGDDGDQPCRCINGRLERLLRNKGVVGYEPTWAPDGLRFAYEQHDADDEDNGRIMVATLGGKTQLQISPEDWDCRQPCWSPDGNHIVCQRMEGSNADLYLLDRNSGKPSKLVAGTDATWHPSKFALIYSNNDGVLLLRDLRSREETVLRDDYYHGAPSISPDGKWIACEASHRKDPEGGPGSWIEMFELEASA